jgi:hypothetical protein
MKKPGSKLYIWEERRKFLHAAAEHPAIRLADALHSQVYALVLQKPKSDYEMQFSPEAIARREEIELALQKWAKPFNLDVDWVVREANAAINTWQLRPGTEPTNPFTWQPLYVRPSNFERPNWFPGVREDEYRKAATEAWEADLEQYIARVKSAKQGEVARRARQGKVAQRYEWAALRVCLRWTYVQITNEYSLASVQGVEGRVRDVCRVIGLPT